MQEQRAAGLIFEATKREQTANQNSSDTWYHAPVGVRRSISMEIKGLKKIYRGSVSSIEGVCVLNSKIKYLMMLQSS